MPKEKYSFAPEIFEHIQRIGEYFGLYENALFRTRVAQLRWSEAEQLWVVSTHKNDDIKSRFVIQAAGRANRPKLPEIPGIQSFKGHTFHTSRWEYEFAGGDHIVFQQAPSPVDVSESKGVEAITERGMVPGGVEYEVDCIIYSAGFEITTAAHRRVDQIVQLAGSGAAASSFLQECAPGYYNREGHPITANAQNSPYILGINAFNGVLKSWRDEGSLAGMKIIGE